MASSGFAITAVGKVENASMLSPEHEQWLLNERRIEPETIERMGLYSGKRQSDGSVTPTRVGNVLAFPFLRHGEEVATKYRAPGKRFWQRPNAQKRFYNADVLDDPGLADGRLPLVITEGEIDCMTAVQSGFPCSVSVPDGAPPARTGAGTLIDVPEGAEDIDPERDAKFSFVQADWDALARVKRIVLAVDADEPGKRLLAELARRLGRARCYFVRYPTECKDLNEVLVKHGQKAVQECINAAKPMPVSGLYRVEDLPAEPELEHVTTGWRNVDDLLRPYRPALMVVSGFANNGKSIWTVQFVAHLMAKYEWPVAIASFEMRTGIVRAQLERCVAEGIHRDTRFNSVHAAGYVVRERALFIAPNPGVDEDTDLDWLLERATTAVIRHGVKCLLIDPWNEIEHRRPNGESLTEYTGRALRKLKRWANDFDCLVVVVVHPAKSAANKAPEDMTLYDVSASAHWANKADLGVIVARLGNPEHDTMTGVFVTKVRYQPEAGRLGHTHLDFDPEHRIFHRG